MNELILGPQTNGSDYFDTTLLAQAKLHGGACPAAPPQKPLSPAEPRTEDFIGPDQYRAAMKTWTEQPAIVAWLNALNSYELLNYYDLPASEYTAHARSGDPLFLALADKCADAWWKHPNWIDEGRKRPWIGQFDTYANGVKKWRDENAAPPPRHSGLIGLITRALRGRPEFWDYINTYTRFFFDLYIKRNLTQPLYNLREGAFAFRFAVILSQVLPDSFPLQNGGTATNGAQLRAQYLTDVEAAAVQYYSRNQHANGSYPWNDDFIESDGGSLVQVTQPFITGILHRGLCDAHQVVVTPSVKENIKNQILNGCRHLYSGGPYIKDQVEVISGKRIRGFHYYYGGGTSVNPTRYANGDIKFPWTAAEAWWLPSARQAISTILGAFAYAYKISGDEYFKLAGDEMYDSAYSGRDGLRAMMGDNTSKNFNQHVMGSSSYKAWVGGTVTTPAPQPIPVPVPAPTPTPVPTPTPTPTPVPSIPRVTLSSPPNGARLSGPATVVAAITSETEVEIAYLIVDDVVAGSSTTAPYSFKLDTTLLKDGAHSIFVRAWAAGKAGDSQKVNVTVANTAPTPTPIPTPAPVPIPTPVPVPTPVPTPTPPVTRSVSYPANPKQRAQRNAVVEAQWRERYRLKSEGDGTAVFEKVP